jgi:hypothetical protein
MWEIFGLDLDSQAAREKGALNDKRTEFKTWDLGDRFRSALTGVSQEDLLEASGQLKTNDLNTNTIDTRGQIQDSLAGTQVDTSGLEIKAGETEAEHLSRLSRLLRTGKAVDKLEGSVDNFDRTSVGPNATASTVQQLGRKTVDTNKTVAEDKETKETRRLEGRDDDRLAMTMELSRLDRKDDREARRDERAFQNRKLDMQEARLDRKDRQAAIQQMMAGLAQMGASIAI